MSLVILYKCMDLWIKYIKHRKCQIINCGLALHCKSWCLYNYFVLHITYMLTLVFAWKIGPPPHLWLENIEICPTLLKNALASQPNDMICVVRYIWKVRDNRTPPPLHPHVLTNLSISFNIYTKLNPLAYISRVKRKFERGFSYV